jgi:signal peptidase I
VRFIKRLAGVEGDEIEGTMVGAEEYWLLGDNSDGSTDSRQLGPFRREDIVARGWLVYWPPERVRRVG